MRLAIALLLVTGALAAAPAPPTVFGIVRPTFHKQEGGAALADDYEYVSGQLMYLSFRLNGFKVQNDKVDLRWQIVAVDPEGRLLMPPLNGEIKEEISYNDKDWLPKITQTIPLPAQLPPGVFKLKISAADEFASARADKEVEFRVNGRPAPQVQGLTILKLRFYRSETDMQGMEPAVYRAGETLVARFELAGFLLGEKNRFEVDYGLSILSGSGKVLYTQEQAASDAGAPFYPQRWLNGALTLNLTAGVVPAEYTLVVKARDHMGNAETESTAKFTVEKQ